MKTLYIDCGMGAAGDMLNAALYELLDGEDRKAFLAQMNALGLKDVTVSADPMTKCGIAGTHFTVKIAGEEEWTEDVEEHHDQGHEHAPDHEHHHDHEHDHDHHHDHDDHPHHHHHASMRDVEEIVRGMPVSGRVREDVLSVYTLIAEAEAHAHGTTVSEIHFHEVGQKDAIADITGVCLLMERLHPDEVVVSPVHVGSGKVRCAHGILPVPAPATAHILQGVPSYGGEIRGELCTPTGAALLKHFATRFDRMPQMVIEKAGYGMGRKDFGAYANCLRILLGEAEDKTDEVTELLCNMDDMTAEQLGFAYDRFFEAGAIEVYTQSIFMKKNRPGYLLSVMCREADKDKVLRAIFAHTTSIGVREYRSLRHVLTRRIETLETSFGPVRRKISEGYGTRREKLEYEDLSRIALEKGTGIEQIRREIEEKLR
ncbi:MAG: nickel pincer cofactor biosynthesis protein LarC [Lachnospiraceae bacterium]|nr:nickel pincer cofactor biosynthesis protein LarC [Lachnospiraceae bacterium]